MAIERRRIEAFLLPTLTLGLLLVFWGWAVHATGTRVFPTPQQVLAGLMGMVRSGQLVHYAADSLLRVGMGFGLAVLVGLGLGMVA